MLDPIEYTLNPSSIRTHLLCFNTNLPSDFSLVPGFHSKMLYFERVQFVIFVQHYAFLYCCYFRIKKQQQHLWNTRAAFLSDSHTALIDMLKVIIKARWGCPPLCSVTWLVIIRDVLWQSNHGQVQHVGRVLTLATYRPGLFQSQAFFFLRAAQKSTTSAGGGTHFLSPCKSPEGWILGESSLQTAPTKPQIGKSTPGRYAAIVLFLAVAVLLMQ